MKIFFFSFYSILREPSVKKIIIKIIFSELHNFFRKIESVVKNVKFAIRINEKTRVQFTFSNIKQAVNN
jgi:ribosome maturation factor RimP